MAPTTLALRFLATSRASSSSSAAHRSLILVHRRLLSASPTSTSTEAGGAGDPAFHSGEAPSEEYTERPPRFSAAEDATTTGGGQGKQPSAKNLKPANKEEEERVPPFGSSGTKLGSQELADPAAGSSFTQRRRRFSSSLEEEEKATPGPEESAARKVREEDREYYRTHKPSPLAEVEYADTRKPITRATDGGAADRLSDDVDKQGSTVEDDTADDSLARAEAMFRDAASRGNPEWPHSRVLTEMLARREQRDNDARAQGTS